MPRTPQEYVDAMRERQTKVAFHMGVGLPFTSVDQRAPMAAADAMVAAVFLVLEQMGATDQQITDALDAVYNTRFNSEPQPDTSWIPPSEWY